MTSKKITAWSFSRFMDYQQCPLKAKLKFVDRLKEPDSPAFAKGKAAHKEAENYLKGATARLPVTLKQLAPQFKELKKLKPATEQQWAFTSAWRSTGWFDGDAWCRVVTDAVSVEDKPVPTIRMVDHKTGKEYPYHGEQLSLYALAAFKRYPEVQVVSAELWYLETGSAPVMTFRKEEEKSIEAAWKKKTAPMLRDTSFKPKPSDKCRWCHFRASNGGPCKH